MPRKTRAELAAEREAALAAERALEMESYPTRLMKAMEEATQKNNYELTVSQGLFELRDRDTSRWDNALRLPLAYNTDAQMDLENLEWDLQQKAQERAEAERRYLAKSAALAKLSKEERELLGL